MTTFYIFRHGQTDWNIDNKMIGHSDVPLNDLGREQAEALRPFMKEKGIEYIYSSPLQRAAETARIASNGDIPIEYKDQIIERSFGVLEGMTIEEVRKKFQVPDDMDFYRVAMDTLMLNSEGLEQPKDLIKRMKDFLLHVHQDGCYNTVGISVHGGISFNFLRSLGEGIILKNGQVAEVSCDEGVFTFNGVHDALGVGYDY